MNQLQAEIMADFPKDIICESYPCSYGALCVETLLGEFYITTDRKITDGGGNLSCFKSRRRYQDFQDWPDKAQFLDRYNIKIERDELIAKGDVLRYLVGIEVLNWVFKETKFD